MSLLAQLVVTDLDGCLLDAASYRWEAARPALDALRRRRVPLVLCSSKTRAEMQPLHDELGLDAPYVFENGGGIVIPPVARASGREPGQRVVPLGPPIGVLVAALAEIAAETGARVRGFSGLPLREVAALTGLGEPQAALARQREHDEPFVLDAGDEQLLRRAAAGRGLRVTKGGRFHHLTGSVDKGEAVRRVLALLPKAASIGLGDAENDVPLLEAVDQPILVPRPDGSVDPALSAAFPGAACAPRPGPEGWSRAVLAALGASEPTLAAEVR